MNGGRSWYRGRRDWGRPDRGPAMGMRDGFNRGDYRNGKFYDFKEIKNVRSAAAVSDNGKTLYLFVGKKLSYHDCAKIFANLNVESAMEFDGGSSSQMTINKENDI